MFGSSKSIADTKKYNGMFHKMTICVQTLCSGTTFSPFYIFNDRSIFFNDVTSLFGKIRNNISFIR